MLARALLLDHGAVGDDHVVVGAEVGRHAGKHTRTQLLVGVLADYFNGEGVCRRADCGVDEVHLALEGLARIRLNGDFKVHVLADVGEQGLRHVDEHFDGLDLLHHEDGLSHAVHVAFVVVAGRHHAVDGAAEIGVLGQVLVSLLCDVQGEFGHVVI